MSKKITMNRKLTGLLLVVGTTVALAGCAQGNMGTENVPQTTGSAAQSSEITEDAAKEVALPDAQTTQPAASGAAVETAVNDQQALSVAISAAGVAQADVSFSQVKLEFEDDYGKQIYDVEFHVGKTEYSYDIDPETGEILSSDVDVDD